MKKIIIAITIVLTLAAICFAAANTKPETHDGGWFTRHGKVSNIDDTECMSCHVDRLDCIRCHEDIKPRDHTSGYVNKGHALKAKWSRNTCTACHTDSNFCDECHFEAEPSTHTKGWGGNLYNTTGDQAGRTGRHCVSCHASATTGNNFGMDMISRGCKTCHPVLRKSTSGTHPPQ